MLSPKFSSPPPSRLSISVEYQARQQYLSRWFIWIITAFVYKRHCSGHHTIPLSADRKCTRNAGGKCTTPLPLLPEWDPGILPPMPSPISNPLRLITALSLSWAASASFSAPAPTQPEPQTVTIALVDTFSPDFYIHTYSPTLDHLIETLPQFRFNIIEIDRRDVARGIAREKPDFLVTSGSTFVELIDAAGAHQIATRQPSESSDVSRTLASTFIVRANSRYRNLESVRGLRAAVSDLTSFDGWLIAEGEIAKRGADPEKYFSEMLETQYGIPDVAGECQVSFRRFCS